MDFPEAERLFGQLLVETRPRQLVRYLGLFTERGFPSLPSRVFELARSADEAVQRLALLGLGQGGTPEVGRFARALLGEQRSAAVLGAVALLERDYQHEDGRLLESVLDVPQNEEEAHSLGSDLLRVAGERGGAELTACLLWVYERTPCTLCRQKSVQALIKWETAPKSLLAECHWDCDAETRTLARAKLPLCRACGRELTLSSDSGQDSGLAMGLALGGYAPPELFDETLCWDCRFKALQSG